MNIFYAAGSRPHGDLAGSRVWHNNLYLPLCDLGHNVTEFDYDLEDHYSHADLNRPDHAQFNETHRPRLEAELLRQISEAHSQHRIDLFFSYFYSSFVRPETIREIRSMGIVTANWFCNASYQFHLVKEIARAYDYSLVPEKFRLEDYRQAGANPVYCQEAANPSVYRPYPLRREFEVTFIGSQYGERAQYVRYLLDKGVDVRVWGPGWTSLCPTRSFGGELRRWARQAKRLVLRKRPGLPPVLTARSCGEPLSDEEMVRMYSRSKISLGFSIVGETHRLAQPIKQVRLRDFEAPMSGAFYMVEYMDELEEFFQIGKEIVCYHDKGDLLDKVKYFLSHEAEREAIRLAGHRRALAEHTWQRRFETAFKEMGLG